MFENGLGELATRQLIGKFRWRGIGNEAEILLPTGQINVIHERIFTIGSSNGNASRIEGSKVCVQVASEHDPLIGEVRVP